MRRVVPSNRRVLAALAGALATVALLAATFVVPMAGPLGVSPAAAADVDFYVAKINDGVPNPATRGGTVSYTFTFGNLSGPAADAELTVQNLPFPGHLRVTSFSTTPADPSVVCRPTPDDSGVQCQLLALPAQSNYSITLEAVVLPSAPVGSETVGFQASVVVQPSSGNTDPTPGNNTATATTDVVATDVSISKVPASTTLVAGREMEFELAYRNVGTGVARNVSVTDTLPAGLEPVLPLPPGCTGTTTITCTPATPDLAPGTFGVPFRIRVTSTPGFTGTVTNTAAITFDEIAGDLNPGNETATATVTVIEAVTTLTLDLVGPTTATAGTEVTYVARYQNVGAVNADQVTVRLGLNTNLQLVSVVPSQGTCAPVPNEVNLFDCAVGTLTPGQFGYITFVAKVPSSDVNDEVSFAARIEAANFPGLTKTVATPVVTSADLALTKTAPKNVVTAQPYTSTITVTNNGPSDAQQVTLIDVLPLGVAIVSASAPGGTCATPEGGPVTCDFTSVPAGATRTVTVVLTTNQPNGTVLTNTATVTSTTPDPVPSNNSASATTTVAPSADLKVEKVGAGTVLPPGQIPYVILYENLGPTSAAATVTDTLPPGVVFVSATPTQGSCTEATGIITCDLGTLANGAKGEIDVIVDVPDTTPQGEVFNVVTIESTDTPPVADPDPSNNADQWRTYIGDEEFDLSVTKVDTPDPVTVGQRITYQIDYANPGPADATNVVLTDTLPPGVAFVSASPGCVHDATAGTVTCDLGLVPALVQGTVSGTVEIVVEAPPSLTPDTTTITNTVTIAASPGTELDPSDNTATAATTVNAEADLSVTAAGPATVVAGEPYSFTLTWANNGPSTARAVSIVGILPFGEGITAQGCTTTGGQLQCPLGDVPAGATGTITVNMGVPSLAAPGPRLIQALIATSPPDSPPDPNQANNATELAVDITRRSDFSLTKTGPAVTPVRFDTRYTIEYENHGPSDSDLATIVDTLPAGVDVVSVQPDRGTCATGTGEVTCTLGAVPAGTTGTIEITISAPADTAPGTLLENVVRVSEPTDTNAANDEARWTTVVVAATADLSITKTATPDPVVVGSALVYSITYTNAGPDGAPDVVITDTLPPNYGQVFNTNPSSCQLEASTRTLTCPIGDVPPGGTGTVLISVAPDADDDATTNTATIASPYAADPDESNNTASVTTDVNPPPDEAADLSVTKTDSPDPVAAGQTLTYTIAVTNNAIPDLSEADATGVTVTDTLPPGTTFQATGSSPSCTAGTAGTVECTVGDLASGASTTVTIVVTVGAGVPAGTLTNTATVSSSTADPTPGNNTATADTTVTVSADLAITVTASPSPVPAGSAITYTVTVSNNGPSTAKDVVVTDTLPAGVTPRSATGQTSTCSFASPVTCSLAQLAPGATEQIVIVADVAASASGSLANNASVTASTPDPVADNNAASVSTPVQAAPPLPPTGSDPGQPVGWAVGLIGVGGIAVLLARRRPQTQA